MKVLLPVLSCVIASGAFADTPSAPAQKKAPATVTTPATAAPSAVDMQQHMKDMQALMDKIEKTQDPAERQRLLAQHREAMHAQLQMMQNMGMGTGMGMSNGMMQCQEQMQSRMGMMSGMMDQMMRHEAAETPPKR